MRTADGKEVKRGMILYGASDCCERVTELFDHWLWVVNVVYDEKTEDYVTVGNEFKITQVDLKRRRQL